MKFGLKRKLKPVYFFVCAFVILSVIFPGGLATAQDQQPDGPVYVVQDGDSLWDIALRFGVSMDDLEKANGIANPNQLTAGAKLVIPGLEGIHGELTTETISLGETLRSLSRKYQVPVDTLVRLNHLTSPVELFAGASLIIPEQNDSSLNTKRVAIKPGQSLLELSVLQDTDPWKIVSTNALSGTWSAVPGDVLRLQGDQTDGPGALPGVVSSVEITPNYLLQGKAAVIKIAAVDGMEFSGSLMGHDLHFFPDGKGNYIAMQGIYAMADPGIYPVEIEGTSADGESFSFTQMVNVQAVNYPYDAPIVVDPTTIDPAVTKPEDAQWFALSAPVTPERLWSGIFKMPTPLPVKYCLETNECWASRFGNRRSYNGSPYNAFHTGLDIGGKIGTEIYAAAAGTVVFTGPLTVRGNATMIDHGWGVYSAYLHQSKILVHPGEHVDAGQLIGLIGNTGRVEGPHLHWEIIVGGVQVDPLDWLQEEYP